MVFIGFFAFLVIDDWNIVRSPDGILQFKSPIEMDYSRNKALTSIGPINLHLYKSQSKDSLQNKYTVTYYELPVYLNMESDSMFHEMSEEIVQSMLDFQGAELDYSNIETYKDGYSRTLRITYNDIYVSKSLIQSNGTHVVNAQCFVPKSLSLNRNVDLFLNGIELLNITHQN